MYLHEENGGFLFIRIFKYSKKKIKQIIINRPITVLQVQIKITITWVYQGARPRDLGLVYTYHCF